MIGMGVQEVIFLLFMTMGGVPGGLATPAQSEGAVTIQVQSISKILGDVREIVREVAGDDAVKSMDKAIKDGLGEKGFSGIDVLRPFAGRLYISGPLQDEADVEKNLKGIVIVPITNQKEFLALIKQGKIEVRESKETKGLYTLLPPDAENAPPMKLRFDDRYAYLDINGPVDGMIAKGLPDITDMIDLREPGLIAYRIDMSNFSKDVLEQNNEQMKQMKEQIGSLPVSKNLQDSIKGAFDWYQNYNKELYRDGENASGRLVYDRTSKEVVFETVVTPKKDTPLAQQYAERKPSSNQFTGMFQRDGVAGILYSIPITSPEIQKLIVDGMTEGVKQLKAENPPPEEFMELFDAAHKGIARTVKSGGFDGAVKLSGPDSDGLFSVSTALTFNDPSKIEAAIRKLVKDAPEGVQSMIELDAAKVNGVNIHKINVGPAMPFEAQNVFGDNASVCIAFAPKAIYVSFGPDSISAIKTSMAAKEGPSAAFDSYVNHAKMQKFVASIDVDAGNMYKLIVGDDAKPVTVMRVTIEGGAKMTYRMIMNVSALPKLMVGMSMGRSSEMEFEAPRAAPIKRAVPVQLIPPVRKK